MSSIKTYEKENDLCLIKFGDSDAYYIGMIDLPQKSWTVDQYNEYWYKSTVNMIPLTDKYVPQQMSNNMMKIVYTMHETCKYWGYHYSTADRDFPTEFDFKILLSRLLALDANIAEVWNKYFEHFYQVF